MTFAYTLFWHKMAFFWPRGPRLGPTVQKHSVRSYLGPKKGIPGQKIVPCGNWKIWFLQTPLNLVRFPDPLGKWVGRTNALRAGNFTSEASSTEKMDCTPPHDTHHWLLHHVYKPWTLSQLAQVISGRSCSTFRCASRLSTFAPPDCPRFPHQ